MNKIPMQFSGKKTISLFFSVFTIYFLACLILRVIGSINYNSLLFSSHNDLEINYTCNR